MSEVSKEQAAAELLKNMVYLHELLELDDFEYLLAKARGILRRMTHARNYAEMPRGDAWNMSKRELLEALESLERPEPRQNLPGRGRLFSHFYLGIRYRCRTARLSENAHADVQRLLKGQIEGLRIEYKGHEIEVHSIQSMG